MLKKPRHRLCSVWLANSSRTAPAIFSDSAPHINLCTLQQHIKLLGYYSCVTILSILIQRLQWLLVSGYQSLLKCHSSISSHWILSRTTSIELTCRWTKQFVLTNSSALICDLTCWPWTIVLFSTYLHFLFLAVLLTLKGVVFFFKWLDENHNQSFLPTILILKVRLPAVNWVSGLVLFGSNEFKQPAACKFKTLSFHCCYESVLSSCSWQILWTSTVSRVLSGASRRLQTR